MAIPPARLAEVATALEFARRIVRINLDGSVCLVDIRGGEHGIGGEPHDRYNLIVSLLAEHFDAAQMGRR